MKPIEIKQKLKPFSSTPGVEIPLPQAGLKIKCYPTFLEVFDDHKSLLKVSLKFKESPKSFIAFLNLHKGKVEVQLKFEKGIVNYDLEIQESYLSLTLKRSLFKEIGLKIQKKSSKIMQLSKGDSINLLEVDQVLLLSSFERLSLGSHKKQHAESIMERKDFKEILPLLFILGQYCKSKRTKEQKGNFCFIQKADELMDKKKHDKLLSTLAPLLQTGFSNLFVPHLNDAFHWGYSNQEVTSKSESSFSLLSEFYWLSRKFFLIKEKQSLFILPHLPVEFHCGRLLGLIEEGLHLDLEWSKKTIKSIRIKANETQTLKIHFQKHIQKCRIRVENKPIIFKNNASFTFEKSKIYTFDRFEK